MCHRIDGVAAGAILCEHVQSQHVAEIHPVGMSKLAPDDLRQYL